MLLRKAGGAIFTHFDDLLGELLDYLDREDLRSDTLLIYLSDNGWHQDPQQGSTPIRGLRGKLSIYEMAHLQLAPTPALRRVRVQARPLEQGPDGTERSTGIVPSDALSPAAKLVAKTGARYAGG
jgi:hypothetical protein